MPRRRCLFGLAHIGPEAVERPHVVVEEPEAFVDRSGERRAAGVLVLALTVQLPDAFVEFTSRVLETLHIGGKRRGAFGQARVNRFRLGHSMAQVLGRSARCAEARLCRRKALVGVPLLDFQGRDRLPRLGLALIEHPAFLLGTPAVEREEVRLAGEPGRFLGRAGDLRIVPDERLFMVVHVLEGGLDGALRLRDGPLDGGHALGDRRGGGAIGGEALAQLADFALRRENASRFGGGAPGDELATADDVTGECRGHAASPRGGADGLVVGLRNPRVPEERGRHGLAVHPIGARDARERPQPLDVGRARPRRRRAVEHEEAAPPGIVLADELETGGRVRVGRHDHMLEHFSEGGLDGPLVPAIDVQVVGHGPELVDRPVGLREHHPRRVAESGS